MATASDRSRTVDEAVSKNPKASGIAVLIGNDYHGNSKGLKELTGALKDIDKAHQVFTSLGAACVHVTNKSAKETKAIVRSLADYIGYPKGYKYIVVMFSGHGDSSGTLLGNDGEKMLLEYDFVSPFQPKNAVSIAKLPKLFFIDACRGSQATDVVQVPRGSSADKQCPRGGARLELKRFPEEGNMLIAFSTLPEKMSYEVQQHGGTWINRVLDKVQHDEADVAVICHKVIGELMEWYQKNPTQAVQQPEVKSTLHGTFSFKKLMQPDAESPSSTTCQNVDQYTAKLNELKKGNKIKDREYTDLANNHVKLVVTCLNGDKKEFSSDTHSTTYDSINMARERVAREAVTFLQQSTPAVRPPKTMFSRLSASLTAGKPSKQVSKGTVVLNEAEAMQELKNVLVDKAGYTLTDSNYRIVERNNTSHLPEFQCTFVHNKFPKIPGNWKKTKKEAKRSMAKKILEHYYTCSN